VGDRLSDEQLQSNALSRLHIQAKWCPFNCMANAGAATIQGGQTVGGESQGLYSTGADKNPPEIYWYAVLKSEHDKYGCVHKW
jgi:hypothetical protein